MTHALLCLLACAAGWFVVLSVFWRYREHNPMLRNLTKEKFVYGLAVIGFLAALASLATSCTPYRDAQAAEPVECRDEALAVILAECTARIKYEENVTEKNWIRKECLERIDAWESCQ